MALTAGLRPLSRRAAPDTGTLFVAAAGAVVTAVVVWVPGARIELDAPGLRVALEVVGFCLVLLAALSLSLPSPLDVRPARDLFVAALVVLVAANAIFAVLPVVSDGRVAVDRGLGFYPWMAGRLVAGALFIAAGLERPRLGLARSVVLGLVALVLVEGLLVATGTRLPVPVVLVDGDPLQVRVVAPRTHAAIEAVAAGLFALGARYALRLHRRSRAPAHRWLAVGLSLQVYAHLHEILFPAILGPVVTTADAFRLAAFTALAVGAVIQIRDLYRSRTRAVVSQREDLSRQAAIVERLARFARQEQDFRTIVTHELATPIAAIHAYAHVLRRHAADTPPAVRRAVEAIAQEARRLEELAARMDELRDSEAASFDADLRPVRVGPLVADAVRFAEGLLGAHPVTARCDDDRVLADPLRLGQALRNVLSNAARYSPVGSPITIRGRRVGDRYELAVEDRGPGIPSEERTQVLDRYVRGSTAAGHDGAGIGLYVAARIAEAHGGSLRIDDVPDGGACVVVDLAVAV